MSLETAARVLAREPQHQLPNLTPHRRTTDGTRVRPPLRDQPPMPAQQRRRRDDEGSPLRAWQQSAGSGEEHTVDGGYRRAARVAPKDCEFVPQDDDFEFPKLLRPNAKNHEFEKPAQQHVARRHQHEASYVLRPRRNSTYKPVRFRLAATPRNWDPNLCTLHGFVSAVSSIKGGAKLCSPTTFRHVQGGRERGVDIRDRDPQPFLTLLTGSIGA
jgi:hypothetical protein